MLEYQLLESKRLRPLFEQEQSEYNRTAYKGTCLSAVLSAVSFLEATTNEIFRDYTENTVNEVCSKIDPDKVRANFENGTRRTVVDKFTLILKLTNSLVWDSGQAPVQDTKLLVKLRNELVHYAPEENVLMSFDPKEVSTPRFFKELKSKFKTDDFGKTIGGYFPDGCLCLGLVEWIYKTVVGFESEFYRRLQLTPHYNHVLGSIYSEN